MREPAFRCLETAKYLGASYADVRIVHSSTESVSVKDGRVDSLASRESHGLGVRALVDGAWGFAATADLSGHAPDDAARSACAIAASSHVSTAEPVRLAAVEPLAAKWDGPCAEDPFSVPLGERIELLARAVDAMRKGEPRILVATGGIRAARTLQLFASTEGAEIEQTFTTSGAGIEAVATTESGDTVRRSYPDSSGGQFAKAGYELVRDLDLVGSAPRVAAELGELIGAPHLDARSTTLILKGDQLALQIHESIGHPLELDRILGMEASFAGTSFVGTHDVGSLAYGSPFVNVTADATVAGGMGSFGYDDEGVPARRVPLIEQGRLVGVLSSRETAGRLGLSASGGAMRADGYNRIPLIRMTNVNLEPPEDGPSLEELIADTDDGLLLSTNRSWSIDNRRMNFQFSTEVGWRIRRGRLSYMVRNPVYSGITTEFWGNCDAVCGPDAWKVHGTPNCGKGEPMQVIGTGHGASPARFRDVQVGPSK